MEEDLSEKARAFLVELEALCRSHGIQITPSGYDSLQFWTLKEGEEPIYVTRLDDRLDQG